MLALAELGAKSAQTEMIAKTVEASDSWNFYQAKSIRQTVIRSLAQSLETTANDPEQLNPQQKSLIADWRKTADRYETDPTSGEGKKELSAHALELQHERDLAGVRYHIYEIASVALQISVVLASTAVVTEIIGFVILAGIGGTLGAIIGGFGVIAPESIHHFITLLGL
jgi:hypothetical protein